MAKGRSYTNGFEYVDFTDAMLDSPQIISVTDKLGLYSKEFLTGRDFQFEEIKEEFGIMKDTIRGTQGTVGKDQSRKMHSFLTTHFSDSDAITPRDIIGKRAFGAEREETIAEVRARKLKSALVKMDQTWETAKISTIVNGTAYAPNGTIDYNWYTQFGKTREVISFELDVNTTLITEKCEQLIQYIQDAARHGAIPGFPIVLCSTEFFSALIKHPNCTEQFKFQEAFHAGNPYILADRMNSSLGARFREFNFHNVRFVEVRGTNVVGQRFIPAGEAYAFPMMDDLMKIIFSPAEKFEFIGTAAREAYAFEYADDRDEMIELQFETNFLTMLKYPHLVVKLTLT